ncbi:RNA-binding protein [Desulfovirgula thermocuniculi]|uniref:YlmH family RNA-binding protein n=1 Tax=Desulfovirgula thermocuniculi TaxID=348842 RepID=UPI000427B414|nr:YlmH/Sll1252 family protein [Desulfovirgula thermocuniculi]
MIPDREAFLSRARTDEEREALARAYDLLLEVVRSRRPRVGDFYDPFLAGRVLAALEKVPGVAARPDGGHAEAERVRVLVFPAGVEPRAEDWQLGFLAVEGRWEGLTHRDFLGALLGLGLRREKVGDIYLHEGRAQIVLSAELLPAVASQLSRVGRFPVKVTPISREELCPPPPQIKEVRAAVASLRLDAVAAAGFGVSRSRMAREITAGRVAVNWRLCQDASRHVKEGDVISARGRGRVKVFAVGGTTRSGRTSVILHRYV